MKSVFSICKIFSFYFFIFYTFSSCKSTLTVKGTEVPKKVFIYISVSATTGKLILKDSIGHPADTFEVRPGQIIKWKIDDEKIKSIDAMPGKKGHTNDEVFSKKPHKELFSKNWKGKIKDEKEIMENGVEGKDKLYDYDINWTDDTGKKDTYDPRIQVK